MRTIEVSEVTKLVRQLCIDANYYLPADLRQAFVDGQNAEESPLGKTIFGEMIANCDLARENNVPVCQDTGMAIVFAEIGQDVHLTGGSFEDAVTEGVRRGYIDGYLRLSVVGDPLRRENTNDNTPCILYTSVVPGDKMKITVAPKGFGSENMTQMKMFTPAATKAQIVDFIADACIHAGSNPRARRSLSASVWAARAIRRHISPSVRCCVRSISTTPIHCTPRWSSRFSIRSTHPVSARRDSAVRLPLLRARLSRSARISPVCRAWLIFPATLPVTQRASCKQP